MLNLTPMRETAAQMAAVSIQNTAEFHQARVLRFARKGYACVLLSERALKRGQVERAARYTERAGQEMLISMVERCLLATAA